MSLAAREPLNLTRTEAVPNFVFIDFARRY
jgi:hypothetical protein